MNTFIVLFSCIFISFCIAMVPNDFRCPPETPYLCGDPHVGSVDCCVHADSCCAPVLNLCCVPWARCVVNNHTGFAECIKRK